jgi:DNA-directed RNA polymerase subunit M/transcription elongation factor TFIIS
MFIIHCPSCARRLQAPDDEVDRVLQCPACHAEFETAKNVAAPNGAKHSGMMAAQSFREGEARLADNDDANEMQRKFSLVAPKKREGTIRKSFALTGFFFGILLVWYFSEGSTLGDIVQAVLLSPFSGIMFAAIGAGIGNWVEMAVRLATRPLGKSLLLTLVGEEEAPD